MTPRQIVDALDQHIVGQHDAKRAVAVAIRNRWRRQQLDPELAQDIAPKNIVMIGPTGVGKTEIARRLAGLTGSPFVKVEASKFTEVGYHGRDVESMIRDLLDQAINLVRAEQAEVVQTKARDAANDALIDLLLPGSQPAPPPTGGMTPTEVSGERMAATRQRLRERLDAGELEDAEVELSVRKKPSANMMFANMGVDQMDPEMADMLEKMMPAQTKRRKLPVADARRVLIEEETDKLLDTDKITAEAVRRTEASGIVFLDEIDKIATPTGKGGPAGGGSGPDVSRQGVQRDLLPIVEGSAVSTRHGSVHTDHILFIAAGAFHVAAVSDLMPELQGRFPIRVELAPLTRDDFVRILTEPRSALTAQQQALLSVEGLEVIFEDSAIEAIADLAAQANATLENIGARRLMTVIEKVFEEIHFDAPERAESGDTRITITGDFVRERVADIVAQADLSKYVL